MYPHPTLSLDGRGLGVGPGSAIAATTDELYSGILFRPTTSKKVGDELID